MGLVRMPGKIYSVADGTVLSVEFVPSAMGGHGDIRGDNFKTKEHFEGTFAAVGQGLESVGIGTGLGTVYSSNGASVSAIASGYQAIGGIEYVKYRRCIDWQSWDGTRL